MQVVHKTLIEDYGLGCVSFRTAEYGLEVVISRSSSGHVLGHCMVESQGDSTGLPTGFRERIDSDLAGAVARRVLASDSLASSRFQRGQPIAVQVPLPPPRSLEGSPQSLEEIRRRAQSIGALVRPCLLSSLPGLDMLRNYQRTGVEWLAGRSAAVLADDMGLGKTAQAITALRFIFHERPQNTALILCPKQLMANWERELARWAPELSYVRLSPASRLRSQAWRGLFNRAHVLITNYEQGRFLQESLPSHRFSTVVLDEAHRVRNAGAAVTNGIRGIGRDRTWALTGTPLERAPSDVWTILSVVEPRRFNLSQIPRSPESIKARARPYIMRRMKRDHLMELPPELHAHEILELLPKQRITYDSVSEVLRTISDGQFLSALTRLRQICDVDTESGESAKVERIVDILQAVSATQEKAIVFSHLINPLEVLGDALQQKKVGFATLKGELALQEREMVIDNFREDPSIHCLLASTRVGGEGLNLVEANHVIFVNRWWNPSANSQAKDRVSRMGQSRTVIIHSFTCRNTVEEMLDEILEGKERLTATIVESLADPTADTTVMQEIARRLKRRQ